MQPFLYVISNLFAYSTLAMSKQFRCRLATSLDAIKVFGVLEEVAGEIPLVFKTEEARNSVRNRVEEWCSNNISLAASCDSRVVGFLLAEPDKVRAFYDHEQRQWLHIAYVGVTKDWRGKGPFPALMAGIMARGFPLSAEVKYKNRSDMARKLRDCFGFRNEGCLRFPDGDDFIWEPK